MKNTNKWDKYLLLSLEETTHFINESINHMRESTEVFFVLCLCEYIVSMSGHSSFFDKIIFETEKLLARSSASL